MTLSRYQKFTDHSLVDNLNKALLRLILTMELMDMFGRVKFDALQLEECAQAYSNNYILLSVF